MKRIFTLSLLFLLLSLTSQAQTSNSDYFEVYTKPAYPTAPRTFTLNRDSILSRLANVADTTSTLATFVIAKENDLSIDSVFFTLVNSQGQTVFTTSTSLGSLQNNASTRVSGNILYYTVGPYSHLKRFTATARIRYTNGAYTSIRSFVKH